MKRLAILTLLFVVINFLLCNSCYAFLNRDVRLLTIQNGLADNNVNCIHKDKDGFMWFGTNNGISRYDGSSVKSFMVDSVSYMNVTGISELSEHCLGILVQKTLWGFNRLTEQFIPIEMAAEVPKLTQVAISYDKQCWAMSRDYLYLFDVKEETDEEGECYKSCFKCKNKGWGIGSEKGLSCSFCFFA